MANGKKQIAPKRAAPVKTDWERDQFSARFTAGRLAGMREIAADMPQEATPVQAVDRAVELALAAKRRGLDAPSTFDMLEERLDRLEANAMEEARAARETANETLRQVRELAGLMSAVAAAAPDGDGGLAHDQGVAAMSLRAWLDARGAAVRSVSALARWSSKSRLTDQHVAMEFEIGVAGSKSPPSVVRVEPIDIASTFARADSFAALSLDCRRDQRGGWLISVRPINADRSTGSSMVEIKV